MLCWECRCSKTWRHLGSYECIRWCYGMFRTECYTCIKRTCDTSYDRSMKVVRHLGQLPDVRLQHFSQVALRHAKLFVPKAVISCRPFFTLQSLTTNQLQRICPLSRMLHRTSSRSESSIQRKILLKHVSAFLRNMRSLLPSEGPFISQLQRVPRTKMASGSLRLSSSSIFLVQRL